MAISVCVVPAGERWVVARLGRGQRVLLAGRHRIMPLLDRVTARIPLDRQVLEWSEHGRAFAVRGRVGFTVVDTLKAATSHIHGWRGLRDTIRRLAMEAVQSSARTVDEPIAVEVAQ